MSRRWCSATRVGLAIVLGLGGAADAAAEPRYESSTPGAGASMSAVPAEVRVCFSEELDDVTSRLEVLDGSRARVDQRNGRVDPAEPDRRCLIVGMSPLDAGTYTVVWRAVSARAGGDGLGSYSFTVSGAASPVSGRPSGSGDAVLCAQYSGQVALPYFNQAQALVEGAPLPGIPPAQAVMPQYGIGPGWVRGMPGAAPHGPVYPYPWHFGPVAIGGGSGVAPPIAAFTTPGLTGAFQAGGQLPPLPTGALPALTPDNLIALGSNQGSDVANAIALGGFQQAVVGNQLGVSNLRYNWVQTYLQMTASARELALSLCGRIP